MDANKLRLEMGRRIEALRRAQKLTRREMAEGLGRTEKYIYDVENGNRGLSLTSLIEVAAYLNVSADYLLTGKDFDVSRYAYLIKPIKEKPLIEEIYRKILEIIDRDSSVRRNE